MNRPELLIFLLVLCASSGMVLAGCSNAQSDVPPIERRAQDLNRSIMCPVCPGESIDQSQVALAVQMRGIVNEKLEAGWSDSQIREFFVERYGPSVLLEPPTRGISLAAWIVPPVGLAAAVGIFVLVVRRMRRNPADSINPAGAEEMSDNDLQTYYERIEATVAESNLDGQDLRDG